MDSFLITIRNFWQPLNMDHFHNVRKMASEIYAYAPDARVLTTYYCGTIIFLWNSHVLINSLFLDSISCFSLVLLFYWFSWLCLRVEMMVNHESSLHQSIDQHLHCVCFMFKPLSCCSGG